MSKVVSRIAELRAKYSVFAKFYPDSEFKDNNGKGYSARYFADVIRKGYEECPIDAYLIMINPGSCRPNDKGEDTSQYAFYNGLDAVESISDPAQKCVMELMEECVEKGKYLLNKIRILNLIDYADGNIKNATKQMLEDSALRKSIFNSERESDFKKYMPTKAPCILAWGIDKKYDKMKEQAVLCLKDYKLVGDNKNTEGPYDYRYIKPYTVEQQKTVRKNIRESYIDAVGCNIN